VTLKVQGGMDWGGWMTDMRQSVLIQVISPSNRETEQCDAIAFYPHRPQQKQVPTQLTKICMPPSPLCGKWPKWTREKKPPSITTSRTVIGTWPTSSPRVHGPRKANSSPKPSDMSFGGRGGRNEAGGVGQASAPRCQCQIVSLQCMLSQ
jgi:hypothetical protein